MAADCGALVSEAEEEAQPEFDPAAVSVPQGNCGVSPQQVTPPEEVSLTATVRNPNAVSAGATVEWRWQGRRLATAEVTVGSTGRETAQTTATIEREGRDQVRASVIDVRQLTGRQPATTTDQRVRAGTPRVNDGEHRSVPDGGVVDPRAPAGARVALARVCGGCAERSRKLSRTNGRLRDVFNFLGG